MKRSILALWSVLFVCGLLGCEKFKSIGKEESRQTTRTEQQKVITAPTYKDIKIPDVIVTDLGLGQGDTVSENSRVAIFYTMWIYDPAKPENRGEKITEISKPAEAKEIALSSNEIVPGFKKGLIGMKTSGKRRLIIPSELGYGLSGFGNVPGNAILLVEVSLEKVH